LLIVVLGVFIGTQVSNWNSDRLDQRRAQGYLLRIEANLDRDRRGIDGAATYWAELMQYGETAVAYAERGALAEGSPWKTVLAFYQASQMLPFSLDDTTYQELKSAGDLGLNHDANLLTSLQAARLPSTRRRCRRFWTATWRHRAWCGPGGSGSPTRRSL
jgi:hypothetical protein